MRRRRRSDLFVVKDRRAVLHNEELIQIGAYTETLPSSRC